MTEWEERAYKLGIIAHMLLALYREARIIVIDEGIQDCGQTHEDLKVAIERLNREINSLMGREGLSIVELCSADRE